MIKNNLKTESAYRTIGEVARELGLIDNKSHKLQTHTLRFWEKQFRQIKPSIRAGKRRYYSKKDFEIIKLVKSLLKDEGLTIKGVKKILDKKKTKDLDDSPYSSINTADLEKKESVKNKIDNIKRILKELKELKNG